jgi:hypothetical protein
VDGAAAALAPLGADAAVLLYRFDRLPTMAAPPPLPGATPYPATAPRVGRGVAALALVDRAGAVLWLEWGGAAADDPRAPVNAAEAVDTVLRVLDRGERALDEDPDP